MTLCLSVLVRLAFCLPTLVGGVIGKGAFGMVIKAVAVGIDGTENNITVAVKRLKRMFSQYFVCLESEGVRSIIPSQRISALLVRNRQFVVLCSKYIIHHL